MIPSATGRREPASLEVRERRLVGSDHAGAGAALDGHIADGHALFHGQCLDGTPGVLDHVPSSATDADLGDDGEDDVFGGDAGSQRTADTNFHGLGSVLQEALCGEHVTDF